MMKNYFFIISIVGFLSSFGCSDKKETSQDLPKLHETTLKTATVHLYNIHEFSKFLASRLDHAYDVGTFLREPQLNIIWNEPNETGRNIFPIKYETFVYLGEGDDTELILGEDSFSNAIPYKFFIQLNGEYGNSTAEGWPLKELILDLSLFENVLLVLIRENNNIIEIKNLDYDDESSEEIKKSFLENNGSFGQGEYVGKYHSPSIGIINFVFNKSCGNGRGVGCYGEGTFIFGDEEG